MNATICPRESSPSIDCCPPKPITMTTPMLMHIVNAGVIVDMSCITRIDRTVMSSFAISKRCPSWSARTSAFTSRAPAMFSCSTLFTTSSRCCTSRNSGSIRTTKKTISPVVTSSSGRM